MNRPDPRLFLCCTLALGAALPASAAPKAPKVAERPNFVFIFMDDMGYSDLGCYGESRWATPHIDSLAARGVRLTDCYSASPVSSPSRAGLLTGRYPVRMGIQEVFYPDSYTGMPQAEVTMAEMLREAGYATSCVGKWHLGSRERFLPLAQGFDEYYGIPYSNDMSAQVILRGNEVETFEVDIDNLTRRYTQEAVSFIKRSGGRPFFLYLAHTMMHVPIYVSKEFAGRSGAGIYGDAVMEVDWSVGQLVEALRAAGVDRNTVIVFTSDNGPWLQEGPLGGTAHPFREGKTTAYEGGVRVPCIACWPGRFPAAVRGDVTCLLDWMPTVAALSGARLPGVNIDGQDLSGLLGGTGKRATDDYAYFRNNREVTDFRSGDWKVSLPAPRIQGNFWRTSTAAHEYLLFNLREDAAEQYNLWEKYPEKAAEMLRKLEAYRDAFGPVPAKLVTNGNNASDYLRRQRNEAQEAAKAAGATPQGARTDGFTDVK